MTELGAFLHAAGNRRREPGVWDCACMPADWARANGYPDPMAARRGGYSTDDEAHAFIAEAGGLVALFDDYLVRVGIFRREGPPQPGDIGALSIAGVEGGAIFTGERWALVAERGLVFTRANDDMVMAVWAVAHG